MEKQKDIENALDEEIAGTFQKLDRMNERLGNLREETRNNLLMLLQCATVGVVICSLSYLGKVGYDYFKHSLKNNVESVERVNTLDVRVNQEGSGKNLIKYFDYKPFGSLDEVVGINKDGKPEVLRVGDKGFNEYLQNWESRKY